MLWKMMVIFGLCFWLKIFVILLVGWIDLVWMKLWKKLLEKVVGFCCWMEVCVCFGMIGVWIWRCWCCLIWWLEVMWYWLILILMMGELLLVWFVLVLLSNIELVSLLNFMVWIWGIWLWCESVWCVMWKIILGIWWILLL